MSSSSSSTNIVRSSDSDRASALGSMRTLARREHSKKSNILYPEPSPRSADFILFPEDAIAEKHASRRRERSQRVRRELVADGLLPSANDDIHDSNSEKQTPLQRATKRQSNFNDDTIVHPNDERPKEDMKLPPAPTPPRLGTPDLDDFDEDLWSCCSWNESTVESYIKASKRSDGADRLLQ